VLADEPTGNLDTRSGADVMEILKQLNRQGRTLIVVSHDAQIIAQALRSIHLRDVQIVPPEE